MEQHTHARERGTTDHEKNYHTLYYNDSGEQWHNNPLGMKLSRKGETSVCTALIGLGSNGQLILSS